MAGAYIGRLKEYDALRRQYQNQGRSVPKYLRSKILRLQETLLETAASEILSLVGKYRGIVILEKLHEKFRGAEESIIPKKTYKKVEKLLADALQLAGLLRIDNNGSYWGALNTVFPGGTSQTCLRCGQVWNKAFKNDILEYSKKNNYRNIHFSSRELDLGTNKITLPEKLTVFNKEKNTMR